MVGLSVKKFAGAVPTTGHRSLPEGFGVEAVNTWFYGNEMRGIRPPVELRDVNPGTKKVFRIPKATPGGDVDWPYHTITPGTKPPPSYLGDSTWLSFNDPDTDIVKGILINDSFDRFYFCSPSTGLTMNTLERLRTGASGYKLGVNKPQFQVGILAVTGGTGTPVTRAYTYTYQSIYGEESAPAPANVRSGPPDGLWQITNLPSDPAAPLGYVPLKYLILYRTVTSTSGLATYFECKKWEIGVEPIPDPYVDEATDVDIVNNNQLETIGWLKPPTDMLGMVGMPNGFLVGWNSQNDVYLSVPYQPHAWPEEYVVSTEYTIVGMGVIGNTCVICTEGYPTVLTGVEPASTSFTKINTVEPCLSRGSIVSTINGVYYASQNGLIAVTAGGLQNVTKDLITREQWIRNFDPQYIRACRFQNGYLALRCVPETHKRKAFYLDPTEVAVALTELSNFENVENVVSDVWSGEIFKIQWLPGNEPDPITRIWRWDPPTDGLMATRWKSKEYQLAYEINLGAYAIYWDNDRLDDDNEDDTDFIAKGMPVRFLVWAGRRLVYDQPVPVHRNGKAVRLPSGFMSDIWQFEIRARAPVYSLIVAQTPRELAGA